MWLFPSSWTFWITFNSHSIYVCVVSTMYASTIPIFVASVLLLGLVHFPSWIMVANSFRPSNLKDPLLTSVDKVGNCVVAFLDTNHKSVARSRTDLTLELKIMILVLSFSFLEFHIGHRHHHHHCHHHVAIKEMATCWTILVSHIQNCLHWSSFWGIVFNQAGWSVTWRSIYIYPFSLVALYFV
jgi:hypothetical protein